MLPGDSGYKKYKLGKFSTARCYMCVELAQISHQYPFFAEKGLLSTPDFYFFYWGNLLMLIFFPEKEKKNL